jgi:hypothetical protein
MVFFGPHGEKIILSSQINSEGRKMGTKFLDLVEGEWTKLKSS